MPTGRGPAPAPVPSLLRPGFAAGVCLFAAPRGLGASSRLFVGRRAGAGPAVRPLFCFAGGLCGLACGAVRVAGGVLGFVGGAARVPGLGCGGRVVCGLAGFFGVLCGLACAVPGFGAVRGGGVAVRGGGLCVGRAAGCGAFVCFGRGLVGGGAALAVVGVVAGFPCGGCGGGCGCFVACHVLSPAGGVPVPPEYHGKRPGAIPPARVLQSLTKL